MYIVHGGGLTPEKPHYDGYTSGTQTSGGISRITGDFSQYAEIITQAGFGLFPYAKLSFLGGNPIDATPITGYGWYCGGASFLASGTDTLTANNSGAGSGFILGMEGTSYPAGYMGDDESLIATLKSAISEPVLTKSTSGSNDISEDHAVITILESTSSTQSVKVYENGTWKNATMKVYSNGEWKTPTIKQYSNNTWK